MTNTPRISISIAACLAAFSYVSPSVAAEAAANPVLPSKPTWISELSISAKESYDDNVLGVSGLGMQQVSSAVTDVGLKLGVNFLPLIGKQATVQTLSLAYVPDFVSYDRASAENYTAHRINVAAKASSGGLSFSFDNAFLYNDGSKIAPTYALDQLPGAAGNQFDKFRNNFAHALARERRNQIQDRYNAVLQFTEGEYFVRAVSSLTYYNLNTDLHNAGVAPYKGYQDYADRYDVNGGVDLGFTFIRNLSATLGYRDGYQFQQQFPVGITADRHYSSSNYQRVLLGLEGKIGSWLNVKMAIGPDFRSYNPLTPIDNLKTTRYYAEAAATATFDSAQSLTFAYKQYLFVASTGIAPYVDTSYVLAYHLNLSKELGVDLGARILEANYTIGNDFAGAGPSLRDDFDYGVNAGLTYSFTKQFNVSVAFAHDNARSGVDNLPANFYPAYRQLTHNVWTVGAQFKY